VPSLLPGLCSISFRKHSPKEVLQFASSAGLQAVEWGGDIHVPPGDLAIAKDVRRQTEDTGLKVSSYGSYYRVGSSQDFPAVVDSARELGARSIRVWAGTKGSRETSKEERAAILEDARRCAQLAGAAGLSFDFEYHDHTLTDHPESVADLMRELPEPTIRFSWQPPHGRPEEESLTTLRAVLPRLGHVHVFEWWPGPETRLPLAHGKSRWTRFLALAGTAPGSGRCALLEFMPGDDPGVLSREAATLRSVLSSPR